MTTLRYAVVTSGKLLCEVSCSPRASIIVLAHREDGTFGYPHATYHVDGTRHFQSLGATLMEERGLPRLDRAVSDAVNVFALTIRSEHARRIPPMPAGSSVYAEIVDVPDSIFGHGQVRISTDIVVPGQAAPEQAFCEKVMEKDLPGTVPPVRITIWKG